MKRQWQMKKEFSFRTHPINLFTPIMVMKSTSCFTPPVVASLIPLVHPVDDNRYLNRRTTRFPRSSLTSVLRLLLVYWCWIRELHLAWTNTSTPGTGESNLLQVLCHSPGEVWQHIHVHTTQLHYLNQKLTETHWNNSKPHGYFH